MPFVVLRRARTPRSCERLGGEYICFFLGTEKICVCLDRQEENKKEVVEDARGAR